MCYTPLQKSKVQHFIEHSLTFYTFITILSYRITVLQYKAVDRTTISGLRFVRTSDTAIVEAET